jgi:hypothetical protein
MALLPLKSSVMLKRKESLGDQFWRMRGIAAVVMIPVIVISLCLSILPRCGPCWPDCTPCRFRDRSLASLVECELCTVQAHAVMHGHKLLKMFIDASKGHPTTGKCCRTEVNGVDKANSTAALGMPTHHLTLLCTAAYSTPPRSATIPTVCCRGLPTPDNSGLTRAAAPPSAARSFAVVFDAGSTGSRVHIFKFSSEKGQLVLLEDTFKQLTPGLGDAGWAADPQRAAASLQPLLDSALHTVPKELQGVTPVELRATAGLRLLPGSQADAILEAVRGLLLTTPFKLAADGISIMNGEDEGAFAWMTLNYLLGLTGKPVDEVVGAVDLGGGSMQQAFAVDEATAKKAPVGLSTLYQFWLFRLGAFCLWQPRSPSTCKSGSLCTCPSQLAGAIVLVYAGLFSACCT